MMGRAGDRRLVRVVAAWAALALDWVGQVDEALEEAGFTLRDRAQSVGRDGDLRARTDRTSGASFRPRPAQNEARLSS